MRQKIDYILRTIDHAKGDDLERAKLAFSGYSPEEMKHLHGFSGESRAQVLRGYELHRELHDAAVAYLKTIL